MPILALLAALAFGAFWYSMPAPRADFSECGGPTRSHALQAIGRVSAADTAARLYRDRLVVYGWPNRAEQHFTNMRYASGELAAYLLGVDPPSNRPTAAFQARAGAPIEEGFLIFYLRDALQLPDCVTARMVPDSARDRLDDAEAKLRHILTALDRPLPR